MGTSPVPPWERGRPRYCWRRGTIFQGSDDCRSAPLASLRSGARRPALGVRMRPLPALRQACLGLIFSGSAPFASGIVPARFDPGIRVEMPVHLASAAPPTTPPDSALGPAAHCTAATRLNHPETRRLSGRGSSRVWRRPANRRTARAAAWRAPRVSAVPIHPVGRRPVHAGHLHQVVQRCRLHRLHAAEVFQELLPALATDAGDAVQRRGRRRLRAQLAVIREPEAVRLIPNALQQEQRLESCAAAAPGPGDPGGRSPRTVSPGRSSVFHPPLPRHFHRRAAADPCRRRSRSGPALRRTSRRRPPAVPAAGRSPRASRRSRQASPPPS